MARIPDLPKKPTLEDVAAWSAVLVRSLRQDEREIAGGSFTLDASGTETTISNRAVTPTSVVVICPTSADAAGAIYHVSTVGDRFFTVTHDLDVDADRTFFFLAIEEELV